MLDLHDIRYVRLGTANLDQAEEYATKVLGMESVRREGKSLYLRSDSRDHTLCYFEGDPKEQTVGFEVASKGRLKKAADLLEDSGYRVRSGTSEECEQRRVYDFVHFTDPSGTHFDLVLRPDDSGRRYFPSRDAGITGFSHVGLYSSDPKRDEQFWTEIAGAKVSDRIGDAALLRINPVHHTLALFPSNHGGVQHINHQVESIDDILRAYYFLKEKGVEIRFGPGRHATSGAYFLYFAGPDGMTFEYSCGVRIFTEEEEKTHRPRQFSIEPRSYCILGSKPTGIAGFES
ncbi:VOC family protein [Paraburkholderia elongata]|uniref:Glyoxalase/bleomycin resistance/extradiol dioxygenase family protein n=1 Tax=Paraburkholderia elongata TaxID=2675747 RepID=A0A972NWS5_9BURK|nr:VOC family protein [Paraburkholderia elongata]NPT60367.1 glyoxalase/bleomycin resistance/extradiol dioxygenase family protein [Paraburkholderia elongata]